MKHLYYLIFALLITFSGYSQAKKAAFEYITMEDGLPENRITTLLQDKKGYIWLGTQNGLVRHDGYTTKVYEFRTSSKIDFYYINCIFEDSKGIIWVGTEYVGLFRYDVVNDKFVLADMGKGIDLKKKSIKSIREDSQGTIWLITKNENNEVGLASEHNNDLYKYNPDTKKTIAFGAVHKGKNKIDASVLNVVTEDSNGKIWLGTSNGLYGYDKKEQRFVQEIKKGTSNVADVWHIVESPTEKGVLWLANQGLANSGGGVTRLNTSSKALKNYLKADGLGSDTIFSLYKDSHKRLWAGTMNGISLIDSKTGTIKNYFPADSGPANRGYGGVVVGMAETQDEKMWIVGPVGIMQFDIKTKTFTRYTTKSGNARGLEHFSLNYTVPPLMDKSGTLYVATLDLGLLRLNNQKSNYTFLKDDYENEKGYKGGTVYKAVQGKDGMYWLAAKNGIIKWDRKANTFETVPDKDSKNAAWNVVVDKDGKIWYALIAGGLYSYDPLTGAVQTFIKDPNNPKSLPVNNAFTLLCDSKNRIWVGTYGAGLCRFDADTRSFIRYPFEVREGNAITKTDKLDDSNVVSINEDSEGNIWVGTNFGGLNKLDEKTGKFSHYNDRSIGMMCITSFYEEGNGIIWAGSYLHGLFRIDTKTGKVKVYRQEDGLLANNVQGITRDNEGNLWIASERGLTRFNLKTGRFFAITKANGLPESQFIRPPFKDANGNFFMVSKRGLVIFNPEDIKSSPIPPATHIQSISYPGYAKDREEKTVYLAGTESPELAYDENRITFRYIGLHYDNPELNQYRYKLEGYDDKWIEAGTQRSVTYTNLSPGTYTFKVKSANSDGIWDEKGSSITVTILPPWWRTWWAYTICALVFAALLRGYIVYRSRKLKYKNRELEEKVALRTGELNASLESLKTTQSQLIQSEKMASLGELTAGIAHEIQNPLNFVNNFSDVSIELLDEMSEELDKGDIEEAKAIAADVKQNLEKINHHGRRADGIVKGMLQHSRASSGQKEPTDINALADEYLRLAYHGLRAKDKSFNAELITHFDESLAKVNVVPQDVGRVLLNLFTNAFYATQDKSRQSQSVTSSAVEMAFKPTVTVTTLQKRNSVEIIVKDNGTGIPDAIKDKILQPFFTTKPTGEGTGLGLSLSYDIIVKGHGGSIEIESTEGQGSEFKISLPAS
ncbi:two-component regulator propeller domain-containing protein [Flavobacterium sp. DGU11]|uniref:histidine kinase n=1 Tax=Flavobacterium arundinis TaxID=3139143 RepID=A0ABU9HX66_9FLAO